MGVVVANLLGHAIVLLVSTLQHLHGQSLAEGVGQRFDVGTRDAFLELAERHIGEHLKVFSLCFGRIGDAQEGVVGFLGHGQGLGDALLSIGQGHFSNTSFARIVLGEMQVNTVALGGSHCEPVGIAADGVFYIGAHLEVGCALSRSKGKVVGSDNHIQRTFAQVVLRSDRHSQRQCQHY